MSLIAKVYVTPKPAILDPQGKAVATSLATLGYGEVEDVRHTVDCTAGDVAVGDRTLDDIETIRLVETSIVAEGASVPSKNRKLRRNSRGDGE